MTTDGLADRLDVGATADRWSGDLPGAMDRAGRLRDRFDLDGPALVDGLAKALGAILGGSMTVDRLSVHDRAAALGRPMVVVHLDWPRLRARLALGVDPPLAHALADRLLGFERDLGELHLQVTPVEWGILGFLAASALDWLEGQPPGPLGPWDLLIDRVGPGPFDSASEGPIVTLRWRVRVGNTTGSARLWLPWAILTPWLGEVGLDRPSAAAKSLGSLSDLADLLVDWPIVGGTATLPGGPNDLPPLRVGKVLLLDGAPLGGSPDAPKGPVVLVQKGSDGSAGLTWRAEIGPAPECGSLRLVALELPRPAPLPAHKPSASELALTVEIGSVPLRLGWLAALRPGDALEVGPGVIGPSVIRLGGRRLATGELVQVDTEIGVRIVAVEVESPDEPG